MKILKLDDKWGLSKEIRELVFFRYIVIESFIILIWVLERTLCINNLEQKRSRKNSALTERVLVYYF